MPIRRCRLRGQLQLMALPFVTPGETLADLAADGLLFL
jgi:hypothetical protein